MNPDQLRNLQAPIKERYKQDPATALVTMRATGKLDAGKLVCQVEGFNGDVPAGLHPAAGGDGTFACSGDMLLQALVACAGVTLNAVATAMNIPLRGGTVTAEGTLDFRGTLGVSKETPVGFKSIRMHFDLDTDASDEQLGTLIKLAKRYCVIYQTLQQPPQMDATYQRVAK